MFTKRNKCSGVSTERNDDLKLFQEDKQIPIFSTNNIIKYYISNVYFILYSVNSDVYPASAFLKKKNISANLN